MMEIIVSDDYNDGNKDYKHVFDNDDHDDDNDDVDDDDDDEQEKDCYLGCVQAGAA